MLKKYLGWAIAVVAVFALIFSLANRPQATGGTTNLDYLDTTDGYGVDGTTVIDGSGNWVGALTGTTGSLSGLLTLNAGVLNSYTNSTSTVVTAYTLKAADLVGYDSILMTPNTAALTLTFPASSTLSTLVPSAGDIQRTCIFNATSTAAATITLATGTGISLERVATSTTSGSAGMLAIPANGSACLTFVRQKATASTFDISVLVTPFLQAE